MNPHQSHPISPLSIFQSFWKHRQLIWQMARREVVGRYKGSVLGLGWSFFNPLLMLAIYTFVFSVVFKARWAIPTGEGTANFALILFIGLIIHAFLAEVLNRAPSLIVSNANYVKKVVFPLEVLTCVTLLAALFHAFVSFVILFLGLLLTEGHINWTSMLAPLTLLPLLPLTMGLGWIFASLGVYLRDIGQLIGILTTILMFLSPIFYPVTALPESIRPLMALNPLTLPVEQTRDVIVFSILPNWIDWFKYLSFSLIFSWVGFYWFQKTRKGFADVL